MRKSVVLTLIAMLLLSTGILGAQTLNVWISTTFVNAQNNWLRAKVEQWSKETGVKVNLSIFPKEIYATKIVSAIESGKVPNVVLQGAAGVVLAAENGLLVPVDSIIDKLGRSDFYPAILKYTKVTRNGVAHNYGIPMFVEARTVEVRSDILKKHGIKIPEHPTMQWLINTAKEVNNPPKLYGWGFTLGKCYDANDNILAMIYAFGGGYISNRGPHGADIFNTAPTWKALSTIKKLYDEHVIPPDSLSWTDFGNNLAFMQGRIAFTMNGLSIYYAMVKNHNPIAKVTKEIFLKDIVIDTGLKSAFAFKSTPEKENLEKDLIYFIFKDKVAYRINMCEKAQLYGLPIFKSQGKIISQEWKEGKWSMFAVDPMSALSPSLKAVWAMSYPLGEPTSVAEEVEGSLIIPTYVEKMFTSNWTPQKVANTIAEKINVMLTRTYGKK